MTSTQINKALTSYGFSAGEWTTLYDGDSPLGAIGLQADNNLIIKPSFIQFYFDNTNGLLYTRTYSGPSTQTKTDLNRWAVEFEGKTYYMRPINAYHHINNTIGDVSNVISYQQIVAFYSYDGSIADHY